MRDTVYFLVFDGFADWQAALALCEIRRPGDWQVQTVGFSRAPVVSMGGLAVQPDLSLDELDLAARGAADRARRPSVAARRGRAGGRPPSAETACGRRAGGRPSTAACWRWPAPGLLDALPPYRQLARPDRRPGAGLCRCRPVRQRGAGGQRWRRDHAPAIWAAWSSRARSSTRWISTARPTASTGTGCSSTRSCRRGASAKRWRPEEPPCIEACTNGSWPIDRWVCVTRLLDGTWRPDAAVAPGGAGRTQVRGFTRRAINHAQHRPR